MDKEIIKVRLKENVTEGDFLKVTFNNEYLDVIIYDINKMKKEVLVASKSKNGINVEVPFLINKDRYLTLGYKQEDIDTIWEIIK